MADLYTERTLYNLERRVAQLEKNLDAAFKRIAELEAQRRFPSSAEHWHELLKRVGRLERGQGVMVER